MARQCWSCERQNVSLDQDLVNCPVLREACDEFRERGKLGAERVQELEEMKQKTEPGSPQPGSHKQLDRLEGEDKAACLSLLEKEKHKQKKWEEKEKEEESRRKQRREEEEGRRREDKRRRREREKEKEK